MNLPALLQTHGVFILVLAIFSAGLAAALSGRDFAKRLAGLCVSLIAAIGFAAAAGFSFDGARTPTPLAAGLVVVTFAYGVVGLSLIVLLKDHYGAIDAAEIAADDDDDDLADRTS
jgi:hypothetical protein